MFNHISPTAACIAALSLCSPAFAATTLTFTDANAISATSNFGTVSTSNSAQSDGPDTHRIVTYTIVDLDFNNDGLADTFVVQIKAAASGTLDGIVSRSNNNGSFGFNSAADAKGSIDTVGEAITFSLESATVTLTGGGTAPAVNFDGFTGLSFRSYGGTARHLLDTDLTDQNAAVEGNANNTSDAVTFAATDSFQVGYSQGDHFRAQNLSFSFSSATEVQTVAVPEPSSSALLGLCFCSLLMRRRRA